MVAGHGEAKWLDGAQQRLGRGRRLICFRRTVDWGAVNIGILPRVAIALLMLLPNRGYAVAHHS